MLTQGWDAAAIGETERLRAVFPKLARSMGFRYGDWSQSVNAYRESVGSVFAPFVLYFDSYHLSRVGTQLMAEKISALLGIRLPDERAASSLRAGDPPNVSWLERLGAPSDPSK